MAGVVLTKYLVVALLQAALAEAWILQRETMVYSRMIFQVTRRSSRCKRDRGHVSSLASSRRQIVDHGSSTATPIFSSQTHSQHHIVKGVECREIAIDLPIVGSVTILEATADAQNVLVDLALSLDDVRSIDNRNPQQLSSNNIQIEKSNESVKLNVGDPYGAVLWPAASAVATRLLQLHHKDDSTSLSSDIYPDKPLHGLSIVELGAGTGLISLAALKAGASKVVAVDYEPLPLHLLRYAAQHLNPGCQDNMNLECVVLDLETEFSPLCQQLLEQADILVAADVLYQPSTGRALAKWIIHFLQVPPTSLMLSSLSGPTVGSKRVLIGDSPGRPGRPVFLQELQRLGVSDASFYSTLGRTCSGPRHELICGPNSSSVSEHPKDLDVAILELSSTSLRT